MMIINDDDDDDLAICDKTQSNCYAPILRGITTAL